VRTDMLRVLVLLLPLVQAAGCVGPLAPRRGARPLALEEHFVYRRYEAPRHEPEGVWSGRGLPLAIALDAEGDSWVLGEFHTQLQHVSRSRSVQQTERIPMPHHPDARPFTGLHGEPSQNSVLGESVIVDDEGRVWLSQGGGHLVRDGANHSRVLSYEIESGVIRAYNLPGNRNESAGLLWDDERGLVWVAESGMSAARSGAAPDTLPTARSAGAILAFDPATAPHDAQFLWDHALDGHLCPRPTTEPVGCFARYALPEGALAPAHLAREPSGAIWFTLFWGAAIGRLDPSNAEVALYPLAPGIGAGARARVVGPGPWSIALSPDGAHVVWTEFFDSTISRMPLGRALDPACRGLSRGRNPCVEEIVVPGADPLHQQVHSLAFDRFGNLWFTQASSKPVRDVHNSIGFVTADWSRVELIAPFARREDVGASYTGIAIDSATGDIWVAEYLPPGVGRLTPLEPDADPATF
jgi:streptogramin lyase